MNIKKKNIHKCTVVKNLDNDIVCGCLVIKRLFSINRLFQHFRITTIPRTGAGKHGGGGGDRTGSSTTG